MHLFVAVPSHSGTIALETAQTLIQVTALVLHRGDRLSFHYQNGSAVGIARNLICAAFMESGADILLMIDADQAISSDAVQRMIDLGQPVVGCIYPKRKYFWPNVDPAAAEDVAHVLHQASEFVGRLLEGEDGKIVVYDGFAQAEYIGTGVILIRKEALDRMKEQRPDLEGTGFDRVTGGGLSGSGRWGFFNPGRDSDGVPVSEDFSFCRRWREIGGEIWADVLSPVIHIGREIHEASYLDYLTAVETRRKPE